MCAPENITVQLINLYLMSDNNSLFFLSLEKHPILFFHSQRKQGLQGRKQEFREELLIFGS